MKCSVLWHSGYPVAQCIMLSTNTLSCAALPTINKFLQTPKGIICPGRQNTKPAPVLPQNFYYRVEIIYEPDEVISYEDVSKTLIR